MITLQPGVTSNAADQIYVGTTNPSGQVNIVSFSVNRQPARARITGLFDGADNVDHGSNITLLVYPSVDAISEFKIERSNYGAEFGRSASGQVNVVTRSGTSQFHGSAYRVFPQRCAECGELLYQAHRRYQGGAALQRLRRDLWWSSLQGQDVLLLFRGTASCDNTVTQTATLPSPAELAGNFAVPVCTSIDSAGNCTGTGTTITNINPISAAYIKDIFSKVPAPDSTGTLVSSASGVFNYQESLIRVDHTFNPRWAVMGRYIRDAIPTKEPYGLFGPQSIDSRG